MTERCDRVRLDSLKAAVARVDDRNLSGIFQVRPINAFL
jgi:hypothetical protein